MNISEKKLENAQIQLTIDVPVERVDVEYKSVFNNLKERVKLDGFRKGKAPLPLVEQRFSERADQEVADNLMKSIFSDAVLEKELTPMSKPQYKYDTISQSAPFSFVATFDVPPTVELGKYKEIPAEERTCKVTDDDINDEIDSIRERFAQYDKKDENGVVNNGDLAQIRLKRTDDSDDNEFKEYSIIVGKSKDESAIDKNILGMKSGEVKEVVVKYPKGYYIPELAGQKVHYEVILDSVSEVHLPELDDEFAKKAGYESVDDMKAKTAESVDTYVKNKIRGGVKAVLLDAIIDGSTFDIPETMVVNEMSVIFRKTQERIGVSIDDVESFASYLGMESSTFLDKLRKEAEKSLKTTLLLAEIAKKEELKVEEEKYAEILESLAKKYNKTHEEIEAMISENNSRGNIESELLLDSAMDFIYDTAKIKKLKPQSLEEFIRSE